MSLCSIGGGLVTRRVTLQPGEVVLKKAVCGAVCRKPLRLLWQGKLFLTTLRLVYLKIRLPLPPPREWKVEVPYESMTRVALMGGPLIWPTITIETKDHIYDFSLYTRWGFLPVGAKAMAEEFIETVDQMRTPAYGESRSS